MNNKIAPSILSADFSNLERVIKALEEAEADLIHLDVMDGHFVPNLTFGPIVVEAVRKLTKLPLDAHLMVDNPEFLVPLFVKAKCDSITVHVEASPNLHRLIQHIKESNIKAAVAVNPATPLSFLDYVLPEIDMVLVMSVNPGFGNQEYIPQITDKIKETRELIKRSEKNIDLQVDGGIKIDNIKSIADAGANVFVAGSAIFSDKGGRPPSEVIKSMRKLISPINL